MVRGWVVGGWVWGEGGGGGEIGGQEETPQDGSKHSHEWLQLLGRRPKHQRQQQRA